MKGLPPQALDVLKNAEGKVFTCAGAVVLAGDETYESYLGCGPGTLFDLASLTKVLVTTTVAVQACAQGLITLELPVRRFFPLFPNGEATLGHLLQHCAGLPAWLPLHEDFHAAAGPVEARELFEARILQSFDESKFLKECVYSDLGFMLLGWALELACGAPLDALFQEWVIGADRKSGYAKLQFLPIAPDIAPTVVCPWRGHLLRGEVHDDNCYVLGGVAGHAGLFGPALDVAALGRQWLLAVQGDPDGLLDPQWAARFWNTRYVSTCSRTLGWDGADPSGQGAAGSRFSPSVRGHLGFTGTSIWIDPEKNIVAVLLTNRVALAKDLHEKAPMREVRRAFHDAVMAELNSVLPQL